MFYSQDKKVNIQFSVPDSFHQVHSRSKYWNSNDYSSSSLDFQHTIKHLDDYIMLHAWTYSIYGYRLPL